MSPSLPSHRRDFVRALALGSVAAPAIAADESKTTETSKRADEVDARMAIIRARFGKHTKLDEPALATIRSEIAEVVSRGVALRKIALSQGDAPFPVFHPYRSPLG